MRDLAAAAAAVPVLALVYAELLVRRLRLVGLLALPVLASVYALECVRRPRLGAAALAMAVGPLLFLGVLAGAAPAGLDARPPDRSVAFDESQLRPVSGAITERATSDGWPPDVGGDAAPDGDAAPGRDSTPGGGEVAEGDLPIEPGPTTGPVAADASPVGEPEAASATVMPAVAAVGFGEPVEPPPSVVRFRPQGSASEVDRTANLSVRFDRAMDREAAASAFSATVDGDPLGGTLRWAEGDTVLVLDPDVALPYGARVVLRVEADARAADGQPLVEARAIAFTVEPEPTPAPAPTPRPAEPSRATGASPDGRGWGWPLGGPITQYFGQSLTMYGTHHGLDIDGDTGDPIRAAVGGTVVVAGYYDRCGGLDVHIDHGDGLVTWYRHLSAVLVSVGQRVERGDRIGLVGSTGCSTGSHLHFAVRRGSSWLDPLDFLPSR